MTNVNRYIEETLILTDVNECPKTTVLAFFVHTSIFDEVAKLPDITIQNVWDYEFQFGETSYSMKLIYVNADAAGSFTAMWNLCKCDMTFPWEDNLTLFVPISRFSLLQRFIELQFIQYDVKTIGDLEGINTTNEVIRIVRFSIYSDFMKKCYITKFRDFYRKQIAAGFPTSFYCTIAFLWLQPWVTQHFDVPIQNDNLIVAALRIILENTECLSNNIFDLVAVRMAFCDCRNLQPTAFVQSVIDRAIVRSLEDPKYIKNNGFDVDQYAHDKNIEINYRFDRLMDYFVYVFQHFLGTRVNEYNDKHCDTIKLAGNSDVLNKLNIKSNFKFKIDGQNFDGMNFKLFNDLAGCHNVIEIILDTNYQFTNNIVDGVDRIKFIGDRTQVFFVGGNTHNFIEEFMLALKKLFIPTTVKQFMTLSIDCPLNNYSIFDNVPIFMLIFHDTNITTQMLTDFSNCTNLLPNVVFRNCKFEYKHENLLLLNNLEQLGVANILEENNTWEFLYDFAAHMLTTSDRKAFQFNREINIASNQSVSLPLRDIKFTLDEYGTKVELRKATTNEIIDLYYTKFNIELDENCDYDFYQ